MSVKGAVCADIELRIKRERDTYVRENGSVGKLDKGMGIAVVGHHHGVN